MKTSLTLSIGNNLICFPTIPSAYCVIAQQPGLPGTIFPIQENEVKMEHLFLS